MNQLTLPQACVILLPDLWTWMLIAGFLYFLCSRVLYLNARVQLFAGSISWSIKLKLWEWSAVHTALNLSVRVKFHAASQLMNVVLDQASLVMKYDLSKEASAKAGAVGDWNKSCIPQFCAQNGLILFAEKKKSKTFLYLKKKNLLRSSSFL